MTDCKSTIFLKNDIYTFKCPHCDGIIEVDKSQLNCRIFRHGLFILNGIQRQIRPHATKEQCELHIKNGLLEGCGKPFQVIIGDPSYAIQCDYI